MKKEGGIRERERERERGREGGREGRARGNGGGKGFVLGAMQMKAVPQPAAN